jgi:hypothetical protein
MFEIFALFLVVVLLSLLVLEGVDAVKQIASRSGSLKH